MCKQKMSRACFSRYTALSTCKTMVLVLQQAKNDLRCFLKTVLLASPVVPEWGPGTACPASFPGDCMAEWPVHHTLRFTAAGILDHT